MQFPEAPRISDQYHSNPTVGRTKSEALLGMSLDQQIALSNEETERRNTVDPNDFLPWEV
tara:strand:+ start:773 stop:952 length:180 start_codon:yes stop_codon:yes gene_type:complete